MRLRHCSDVSGADWLARSGTPPHQLITFGPAGLLAYAMLRFVPGPSRPGQSESDAPVPDDHPSDIAQARRALHRLAAFTATPDDCVVLVGEGYSDIPLPPGPRSSCRTGGTPPSAGRPQPQYY